MEEPGNYGIVSHLFKRGAIAVPAFIAIIATLVILDIRVVFEPPLLLFVMNTLFVSAILFAVAYISARSYLISGLSSLLLLGCGVLALGSGNLIAGWLIGPPGGPNVNVIIHNIGALLGSVFHVASAAGSSALASSRSVKQAKLKVMLAYLGVLLFMTWLTTASLQGAIPPFFIQDVGPTPLRQGVLGTAAALFAASSLAFMILYSKSNTEFPYWYSLALVLTAIGLSAVFLQKAVGSPIGWAGRSAQYLSGIYFLYAVLNTSRGMDAKRVPLEKAIAKFFRESKANYRALVETATDAIVSLDHEGRVLLWNPAAEKIFGYSRNEAAGSPLIDLIIPDEYPDKVRRWIKNLAETEKRPLTVKTIEIEVRRKDGEVFTAEFSGSARKTSYGWTNTLILRDITERKRTEEELQKSEERFRSLTESTSDWIWEVDQNGVYTYASPKVKELLGYEPEEVVGKTPFDLMPPDEAERVARIFQSISEFRRTFARLENTNLHKDGHLVVLETSGVPVFDDSGNFRGYRGIDRDITQRKRTEAYIKTIFESARDGIAIINEKKVLVDFNKAVVDMLGYTPEEIKKLSYIELTPEEYAPLDEKAFKQLLERGYFDEFEKELIRKDGTRLPVLLTGAVIGGKAEGSSWNAFAFIKDITERKRMEELKKLAAIGELATMVAHDLRNPLTSIRNTSFYLKNAFPNLANTENKTVYGMLDTMEREIIVAGDIVNDLLYFTGIRPLQIKRQNVNRLIEYSLTGSDIPENVKVERNFDKKAIAPADEKQLKRVFLNLIKNAVQAMPNGGKLTVKTSETKDHIEITFTDTGIGIPKENVSKIFQPLFTTKAKGTGFGLPICKKIVEQHDGIIDIKSKIGKGTIFIIKLPKGEANKQ